MEKITSTTNEQVKETAKLAQKKYRMESGLFLVEGFKCIEQAFKSGFEVRKIFVLEDKMDKINGKWKTFQMENGKWKMENEKSEKNNYPLSIIHYPLNSATLHSSLSTLSVNEAVMKKITTTDSAPEVVAVVVQKKYPVEAFKNFKKIALFENIKDAGNLGTIIRSACAFGIEGIILAGDCVDLYNPKVVRSAVGSLFQMPVLCLKSVSDVKINFPNHKIIATAAKNEKTKKLSPNPVTIVSQRHELHKSRIMSGQRQEPMKKTGLCLVMFGSEAQGLSGEALKIADDFIAIEHDKKVESLNLSVAASIIFYEL